MKNRAIAAVTLSLALIVSSAAAQDVAPRPPEVDVLADAVDAISRMHMVPFTQTDLWQAAIDGMAQTAASRYAFRLTEEDSDDWGSVMTRAARTLSSAEVEPIPDSVLWEAAIDGMINALNDPYAELFTPQEADAWEEETTGNYSGIGLQITLLNDEITVTAVFRGFPANERGISVGDVIVGVNEHDASGWTTGMAADSIRGPVGTDVEVRIKRAGYPEPVTYEITRAEVHVPAVEWGVLDGGIGYVVMDRVARNAAREMSEALTQLDGHSGLIIDLRRNPGGFLDESLMLADLFLQPGSTLASTEQRVPGSGPGLESEMQSFNDRWPQMVPDLPIVILVDQFTASGAEILAGALQDYDRAIVLGERSFGKGVVQTVMPLPHGRRLRFTTGTWLTPLGRSLQRARDSQGFPLPENVDELPSVETQSGRALVDGGGIFPDRRIQGDTLTLPEQNLLQVAGETQFPLGLRIAEFGFRTAAARREAGEAPDITEEEFQTFVASLEEEGLAPELLDDPVVLEYLRWRGKMAVAQRSNDLAAEARFRTQRDPVLTEAIRLLQENRTQAALFGSLARESGTRTGGGR